MPNSTKMTTVKDNEQKQQQTPSPDAKSTKKTSKVWAYYKVQSFWKIKGDLDSAYYYSISSDILSVVWKDGDDPVEYFPDECADDHPYDNFKYPDEEEIEIVSEESDVEE